MDKTIKTTQEWFDANPINHDHMVRPQMRCVDGFTMSVQASHLHYCIPRETDGR